MRRGGFIAVLLCAALPALAQDATPPVQGADALSMGEQVVRSPVLTVDPERLFSESLFGRRIAAEVRAAAEALDAENQAIEQSLVAEEQSLTDRRPGMDVAAFRAEAEAFDGRVQRIRAEQDAKEAALQDRVSEGRDDFIAAATPILAQIMIESGAAVVLDRRSVFLGAGAVDITDRGIAAIDNAIGDGSDIAVPEDDAPPADGATAP